MVQHNNFAVNLYTEETPNPETMKFVASKLILPGATADFPSPETADHAPLPKALFTFPYIKGVFIASNFVTLTKTKEADWKEIIPPMNYYIKTYLDKGLPIISNEHHIVDQKVQENLTEDDIVTKIKQVLEIHVQPIIEMDGGAILYKNFKKGKLTVTLHGACSGCPSSMITLKKGIEYIMKRNVPEVTIVEAAE